MSIDILSIGQNLLILGALLALCVVIYLYGRLIAGWSAVILFSVGEYGWAMLAFFLWIILDQIHREEMFEVRLYRIYNGPWID